MAKASKQANKKPSTKRLVLPNDKPVHLPISFEEAIKMAVNTNINKTKKDTKPKN